MSETPDNRQDQPEVIVHEDALAELIKKAKPEEIKEIEALVVLVQNDMKATQKSMESLLTDMASNPANLEQKDLVKTAIEAAVFSMSDEHRNEEARDIVYQTLTRQADTKKSFLKKLFGPEGFIGGIKNAVKQKFLGVDLKKEQEEKQQTINAVVQKYAPQIDDLKKKLGFTVDAPVAKTPDPTVKKEEEKKDETKKSPDAIDINDEKIKPRMEKVKESYTTLLAKYNELGAKGNYDNKDVSLINPAEKSIIVDPKTQTLFYFVKGKAEKVIQVALGKGKDEKLGAVGTESESNLTPPGSLVVLDPKTMNDGSNRPALILDGLDEANKNTKNRAVLMHPSKSGTTAGDPTSKGCITMSTENYAFISKEMAKGAMIQVINEGYDRDLTDYFAKNVDGKKYEIAA